MDDTISRQAAIDAVMEFMPSLTTPDGCGQFDREIFEAQEMFVDIGQALNELPPAQPEKEIPKRVLWTGWKGYRDTRYKCPNCKKPVKNDDVYCHRCGQKLMFPHVDWTPYVEGQKQELIVRWDDE